MTLYKLCLYLHILGAAILFIAIGVELLACAKLKNSNSPELANSWLGCFYLLRKLYSASMILILIPGIYMMATIWHFVPWIIISFIMWAVSAASGNITMAKKIKPLLIAAKSKNTDLDKINNQFNKKSFLTGSLLRTFSALGIVFLMTIKPDMTGSIIAIVLFLLAGFILAQLIFAKDVKLAASQAG